MADVFSRLLLATEGTSFDAGAERLAFAMARRCGRPLTAVVPIITNPEFEVVAPELAARAEGVAAHERERLGALAAAEGVTLELAMRRGEEAHELIVDEARRRGSDLIVLRRRGRRGLLARVLVGEMVTQVLIGAPCSVLFVPGEADMWSRAVAVGFDGSPLSGRAVEVAADIARACALPLGIVAHAAAAVEAEAHAAALRASGLEVRVQAGAGRGYQAITSAAEAWRADLLVVGATGAGNARGGFGSTARDVVGHAKGPVLVVKGA